MRCTSVLCKLLAPPFPGMYTGAMLYLARLGGPSTEEGEEGAFESVSPSTVAGAPAAGPASVPNNLSNAGTRPLIPLLVLPYSSPSLPLPLSPCFKRFVRLLCSSSCICVTCAAALGGGSSPSQVRDTSTSGSSPNMRESSQCVPSLALLGECTMITVLVVRFRREEARDPADKDVSLVEVRTSAPIVFQSLVCFRERCCL